MKRHLQDYVLWVLCVDDYTYEVLVRLQLTNVRLLKLSDLETLELLSVKPGRSIREYCWTLTPFAPRFVFEADPSVCRVTYLDADLWFRKTPQPIFDELISSGKHVLITDHAYAPEYDQSSTSGQYCVQFMTFTRHGGESVLKSWEQSCIEWCFARYEDGKFGDQKYLDEWPQRYGHSVHVLSDKELALAPWNASRFPFGNSIFYHFQGLRIISQNQIDVGNYYLPKPLIRHVYQPYYQDLREALDMLIRVGVNLVPQTKLASPLRRLYRKLQRLKPWILPFISAREHLF